ncbi:unnamed protein product [Peronospora destructor]|uniref:MBD domain-containing protein n=1 Tax=Peronospora destructor TaxID=86335 RepID=A0AAV0T7E4_9STRA|nr:unnamed protein product [Peronospora destructor]
MTHIESKDPFGFVGSHIVRRQPRTGEEEHGWLTRYNEALDCYTLFVPGSGEPRLLARGEVLKYLSAFNIEFHEDDAKDFPPPVKDMTTSRYLGVTLCRYRQQSSERGNEMEDKYGSMEEISESAVINGMIALTKSPFFSSPSRTKKQKRNKDELKLVRRKRQRMETTSGSSDEEIPSGSVTVIEDVADKQQDDDVVLVDQTKMRAGVVGRETEPTPNILEIMSSTLDSTARKHSLEMASHPVDDLMLTDKDDVAGQDDIVKIQERHKEPDSDKSTIDTTLTDLAAQPETPKNAVLYC